MDIVSIEKIIKSVSKKVNRELKNNSVDIPIIIDNEVLQKYDNSQNSCIYIKATRVDSNHNSEYTNDVTLGVNIEFFPASVVKNKNDKIMKIIDILIPAFSRSVIIDDDLILDIFGVEWEVKSDTVGSFLIISLDIIYTEQVTEMPTYEIAQTFSLNKSEKTLKEIYEKTNDEIKINK